MKNRIKSSIAALVTVGLTVALGPTAAMAGQDEPTSLAQVLDIQNPQFDGSNADFDILTAAINAVLENKPGSAVAVLADESVALTAFIPTDGAFRKLVRQLGNSKWRTMSESSVFTAVAGLGIDAVEKVLLHHVVVGPAINLSAAVKADGATLTSAAGQPLKVQADFSLRILGSASGYWNPTVNLARTDLNAGNPQLAHVINNVIVPKLG